MNSKNTITEKTLKIATHQFIKQFREDEYAFCSGLKKNANDQTKLLTLNKALAKFKVARNFRLYYDVSKGLPRFQPIIDILDMLDPTLDNAELVLQLENEMSNAYGGTKMLSAATKLAWLKKSTMSSLSTVVIYDSYVTRALQSMGLLPLKHTYLQYLAAWHEAFNAHISLIIDVIESQMLSNPEDMDMLSMKNLDMRIFDIYLYTVGDSLRAKHV